MTTSNLIAKTNVDLAVTIPPSCPSLPYDSTATTNTVLSSPIVPSSIAQIVVATVLIHFGTILASFPFAFSICLLLFLILVLFLSFSKWFVLEC